MPAKPAVHDKPNMHCIVAAGLATEYPAWAEEADWNSANGAQVVELSELPSVVLETGRTGPPITKATESAATSEKDKGQEEEEEVPTTEEAPVSDKQKRGRGRGKGQGAGRGRAKGPCDPNKKRRTA